MTAGGLVCAVVSCDHAGCHSRVEVTTPGTEETADWILNVVRSAARDLGWRVGADGEPDPRGTKLPEPPAGYSKGKRIVGKGRDLCPEHLQ